MAGFCTAVRLDRAYRPANQCSFIVHRSYCPKPGVRLDYKLSAMATMLAEGSRCSVVVSAVGLDSSSGTSRPGDSKGKGTEAVPSAGETKSALAMPSRTGGSQDKATGTGTDPLCELRRSMQKQCFRGISMARCRPSYSSPANAWEKCYLSRSLVARFIFCLLGATIFKFDDQRSCQRRNATTRKKKTVLECEKHNLYKEPTRCSALPFPSLLDYPDHTALLRQPPTIHRLDHG